jgi:hypothetical protein
MSTDSAYQKLNGGHGRVICKGCRTVIVSCRCLKGCSDNVQEDLCDDCEKLILDSIHSIKQKVDLEPDHQKASPCYCKSEL